MRRILYISIGLAVLAGAGWYGLSYGGHPPQAGGPAATGEVVIEPGDTYVDAAVIGMPAPPPKGYVEYRNTTYGFSFYHAPEAAVREYDEGGGAATITLENYDKGRGMQIFIVPYGEPTISDARFHKDVPSGVRENVEPTTVGVLDVPAVTFTSYDAVLGETRELWFIYHGYLYEVTTFKGVADWFAPIIRSWRFI